jgi:hypothetical protein
MISFPEEHGSQFTLAGTATIDDLGARACLPDNPDDVYGLRVFALVPTIIIMVLSITTYGLRLFCRKKTGQALWWDDYLMGIGLLISLEPSICEFLCKTSSPERRWVVAQQLTALKWYRMASDTTSAMCRLTKRLGLQRLATNSATIRSNHSGRH